MVRRYLLLCSGLLILVAGCMQTRHVETSSVTNMSGGSCGSGAGHDGTFSERKWCGPWFTQPAKAQP